MTKTGPRLLRGSVARAVVIQATKDFTVKTVQKAADIAVRTGSRLYTDSASSYQALQGYAHAWSCTCILRVIPNAREPVQYPFPTCVRGIVMLSNIVFYQLGLIALIWVFLMLYGL